MLSFLPIYTYRMFLIVDSTVAKPFHEPSIRIRESEAMLAAESNSQMVNDHSEGIAK